MRWTKVYKGADLGSGRLGVWRMGGHLDERKDSSCIRHGGYGS